jgi:nitrous oxidase accessory protein
MKIIKLIPFIVIFLLTLSSLVALSEENPRILYVAADGTADYNIIQDAIDDAKNGDVILVNPGTYYENLVINKSITLRAYDSDKNITIIDGNNKDSVIQLTYDEIHIQGFTITNSSFYSIVIKSKNNNIENNLITNICCGIHFYEGSNRNLISKNIIEKYEFYAIDLVSSFNNIFENNTINGEKKIRYAEAGITIFNSSNNIIRNNTILSNNQGMSIFNSSNNNTIKNNFFMKNKDCGIYINRSNNNLIYHNNFIDNKENANDSAENMWYNSEITQGNYWSDYIGLDKNNDARGDDPYDISGGDNRDMYPLMSPYMGRLIVLDYYVDESSVHLMLVVGMIITIIFCLPIGLWWRKKYFK